MSDLTDLNYPPTDTPADHVRDVRSEIARVENRCRQIIACTVALVFVLTGLIGLPTGWPGRLMAVLALMLMAAVALLRLAALQLRPAPTFTARPRSAAATNRADAKASPWNLLHRKQRLCALADTVLVIGLASLLGAFLGSLLP
ncbi:hypothetical protein [Actinomadura macrotermitis]|uniref:Uncharacterized protein n=1 Tax=Actinomadura macrotermitis TaxID=2585200 RepID=A0A7K0C1B3_9ACTN|nr:hypothetical protein [Actinomadura macrotermitis]MQY07251.1 hypothetical protein [Actinomadura macrotermitis]